MIQGQAGNPIHGTFHAWRRLHRLAPQMRKVVNLSLSFTLVQVDAILFLDVRALLHTMFKRIQAWRAYRLASHNLHHSFPDASPEQLQGTAEGCAICKDAMQVMPRAQPHNWAVISGMCDARHRYEPAY